MKKTEISVILRPWGKETEWSQQDHHDKAPARESRFPPLFILLHSAFLTYRLLSLLLLHSFYGTSVQHATCTKTSILRDLIFILWLYLHVLQHYHEFACDTLCDVDVFCRRSFRVFAAVLVERFPAFAKNSFLISLDAPKASASFSTCV